MSISSFLFIQMIKWFMTAFYVIVAPVLVVLVAVIWGKWMIREAPTPRTTRPPVFLR